MSGSQAGQPIYPWAMGDRIFHGPLNDAIGGAYTAAAAAAAAAGRGVTQAYVDAGDAFGIASAAALYQPLLGFAPYSAANPAGYQTAANVNTALAPYALTISLSAYLLSSTAATTYQPLLGFTPYNATNPSGFQTSPQVTATVNAAVAAGSVAPATATPVMDGTATVGTSLLYARGDHVHASDTSRYAASNPSGYIAASGAPVQSVFGRTGTVVLASADVTTALTFTPYNATNPSGYITSAAVPGPATVAPLVDSVAAVGTSALYARQDHVHAYPAAAAITSGTIAGVTALATTGPVTITDPTTGGNQSLTISAVNDTGNGAGITLIGNGSTTPNKTLRVQNGNLQVVNSAYGAVIASITDAGLMNVAGGLTSNGPFQSTYNQSGVIPPTFQGYQLGWNYTGGAAEIDFINCYTSPTTSFKFLQRTSTPALVSLLDISPAGNLTAYGFLKCTSFAPAIAPAVAAAGTTLATATAITATTTIVTACASGAGVILPVPQAGEIRIVRNRGANALLVYPQSGAVVEAYAASAGTTIAPGAGTMFIASTTTSWTFG